MTIPENLTEKRNLYRDHGDNKQIAALANLTPQAVWHAFKVGRASEELIIAASKYYSAKEQRISASLSQN